MKASESGRAATVEALLKHNAKVNVQNKVLFVMESAVRCVGIASV